MQPAGLEGDVAEASKATLLDCVLVQARELTSTPVPGFRPRARSLSPYGGALPKAAFFCTDVDFHKV